MSNTTDKKTQNTFETEEATEDYAGVKHTFNGTLFIPTAESMKQSEQAQAARSTSPIGLGEQMLYVPTSAIPHARPRVKMKMTDALKMRQRG